MNIRRALWRFITVAGKGLRATRITSVSLGSMSLEERLYWLACALLRLPDRVITAGNNWLYLPKRSVMASAILLHGGYEPATTSVFQELVQPGMTVVDAGAHVGYFTLLAAGLVGETGRVYAFEPEPENYALLVKNVEVNGYRNVVCLQRAVSNKPGDAKLFVGRDSGGHSLYPPVRRVTTWGIPIETTSLDDFFRKEGWPPVHLIKMDIEGAEWFALEGMREVVRQSNNLKLIVEFFPDHIRAAGVEPAALLNRLQHMGFSIRVIDEVKGLQPLDVPRLLRHSQRNLLCERV